MKVDIYSIKIVLSYIIFGFTTKIIRNLKMLRCMSTYKICSNYGFVLCQKTKTYDLIKHRKIYFLRLIKNTKLRKKMEKCEINEE